jgi:hypothetical protein
MHAAQGEPRGTVGEQTDGIPRQPADTEAEGMHWGER